MSKGSFLTKVIDELATKGHKVDPAINATTASAIDSIVAKAKTGDLTDLNRVQRLSLQEATVELLKSMRKADGTLPRTSLLDLQQAYTSAATKEFGAGPAAQAAVQDFRKAVSDAWIQSRTEVKVAQGQPATSPTITRPVQNMERRATAAPAPAAAPKVDAAPASRSDDGAPPWTKPGSDDATRKSAEIYGDATDAKTRDRDIAYKQATVEGEKVKVEGEIRKAKVQEQIDRTKEGRADIAGHRGGLVENRNVIYMSMGSFQTATSYAQLNAVYTTLHELVDSPTGKTSRIRYANYLADSGTPDGEAVIKALRGTDDAPGYLRSEERMKTLALFEKRRSGYKADGSTYTLADVTNDDVEKMKAKHANDRGRTPEELEEILAKRRPLFADMKAEEIEKKFGVKVPPRMVDANGMANVAEAVLENLELDPGTRRAALLQIDNVNRITTDEWDQLRKYQRGKVLGAQQRETVDSVVELLRDANTSKLNVTELHAKFQTLRDVEVELRQIDDEGILRKNMPRSIESRTAVDKVARGEEGAKLRTPAEIWKDLRDRKLVERDELFQLESHYRAGYLQAVQQEKVNALNVLQTAKDNKLKPEELKTVFEELRVNSRRAEFKDNVAMSPEGADAFKTGTVRTPEKIQQDLLAGNRVGEPELNRLEAYYQRYYEEKPPVAKAPSILGKLPIIGKYLDGGGGVSAAPEPSVMDRALEWKTGVRTKPAQVAAGKTAAISAGVLVTGLAGTGAGVFVNPEMEPGAIRSTGVTVLSTIGGLGLPGGVPDGNLYSEAILLKAQDDPGIEARMKAKGMMGPAENKAFAAMKVAQQAKVEAEGNLSQATKDQQIRDAEQNVVDVYQNTGRANVEAASAARANPPEAGVAVGQAKRDVSNLYVDAGVITEDEMRSISQLIATKAKDEVLSRKEFDEVKADPAFTGLKPEARRAVEDMLGPKLDLTR